MFYSGGNIFKGIVNISLYFIAMEYTRVKSPFTMGMELGQIFWLIFYPIDEYLDLMLETGAVWG